MIKIAIPNKGRLSEPVKELLEKAGIRIVENGRKLSAPTSNKNIEVMFTRAADIPWYVSSGAANVGITGEDMIRESGVDVSRVFKLKLGSCRIGLAVPNDSKIKSRDDLYDGIRIATKLSKITEDFLNDVGIKGKIIRMEGAIELAPNLGMADAILDQVSTGRTLAENGLRLVDTIFESTTYLISNKEVEKKNEIEELKLAFESISTAEEKRYIMANVTSEEELEKVVKVMPCMESPTVLKLAKEGEYCVHSVIDEGILLETLRKLKEAGAEDILVMNMSRVLP